jgi:hypothetical protein
MNGTERVRIAIENGENLCPEKKMTGKMQGFEQLSNFFFFSTSWNSLCWSPFCL